MPDFAKELIGYGGMGICLGYFIYKDMKLTKDQTASMSTMNTSLVALTELVKIVKDLLIK